MTSDTNIDIDKELELEQVEVNWGLTNLNLSSIKNLKSSSSTERRALKPTSARRKKSFNSIRSMSRTLNKLLAVCNASFVTSSQRGIVEAFFSSSLFTGHTLIFQLKVLPSRISKRCASTMEQDRELTSVKKQLAM